MSVFSKIKMSRKAAKQHKDKVAEKDTNEVTKTPYKHIPTHAAVDALSGAPSNWKNEDRPKIAAHHKRRSQMVISRTGSSLSTISYANASTGPSSQAPPLPRNSSYGSYNPAWFDKADQTYYLDHQHGQRRYRPSRGHSYNDSGIGASVGPSPLASNGQSEGISSISVNRSNSLMLLTSQPQSKTRLNPTTEVSPVVSSGNSSTSSSSDHLEINVTSNPNRMSQRPQPNVYAEKDILQRLHTSTTRKLGEAPLSESAAVVVEGPTATNVVVPEAKQKRQRWNFMGKRNSTTVVA